MTSIEFDCFGMMGNPGANPGACYAVGYRDVSCGIFVCVKRGETNGAAAEGNRQQTI